MNLGLFDLIVYLGVMWFNESISEITALSYHFDVKPQFTLLFRYMHRLQNTKVCIDLDGSEVVVQIFINLSFKAIILQVHFALLFV